MRDENLDRVLEILGQQDAREQVEPVIRGIALLRLRQQDGQPSVLDALERIDAQLGAGVATPDHVLTVAPTRDRARLPSRARLRGDRAVPLSVPLNSGAGILVYIADTGLLDGAADTHPWLRGVRGDLDPLPEPQADRTQVIPPHTGHGTFVGASCGAWHPRPRSS